MVKKNSNIDDEFVEIDVQDENLDDENTLVDEERRLKREQERLQKQAIKRVKDYDENDDNENDNDDDEEEDDEFEKITLKNILGGDILQSKFFLSKIMFIIFCVVLMLLYTGNRYGSLQDIITIDSLKRELVKMHNLQVTKASDRMNKSRQSNIERMLEEQGDSMMLKNNNPPYSLVGGQDSNEEEDEDDN